MGDLRGMCLNLKGNVMTPRCFLLALLIVLGMLSPAWATWIPPDDTVPAERLIENLKEQIRADPKDANALATLARVHSLIYAELDELQIMKDRKNTDRWYLYEQGFGSHSRTWERPEDIDPERIAHLHKSLRYYRRAVEADPEPSHYWLGLGYMYDEGAKTVGHYAWPLDPEEFDAALIERLRATWEDKALEAYDKALGKDPKIDRGYVVPPLTLEAASAANRILAARKERSEAHEALWKRVKVVLREYEHSGRAITPIIFSLDTARPLSELLNPVCVVDFDLDGSGRGDQWPWLQPDTALLVWDADGRGDVPSGRQLFGSVTWWMFWRNGYEAMRALDDNHDGWLAGPELTGLAVWQDANSNGAADASEVRPAAAVGIRRLAVTVTASVSGMPSNPTGLEMTDGRRLPTYDWIVSPVEN